MIEALGKKNKERQNEDFYATPSEEVLNILSFEKIEGNVLENSCGMGHISEAIKKIFPNKEIISTDLYNRGYGEVGLDFLNNNYPYIKNIDNIVMNPPFKLINEFIKKSLKIAKNKIIVLGRIQLLESKTRYEEIFKQNPPCRVYVYVDRIHCYKNGDFSIKQTSNAMTYAWYVFDIKNTNKKTELIFLRRNEKELI